MQIIGAIAINLFKVWYSNGQNDEADEVWVELILNSYN